MAETLYIKEWNRVFHYAAAIKGDVVKWRRSPINTSPRARILALTREGRDAMCVFNAICDLVARYRSPGELVDDHGQPIDELAVHLASGIPLKVVKAGFEFLKEERIGWLSIDQNVVGSSTDDRPMIDEQSTSRRSKIDPEQERNGADKKREEQERNRAASAQDLFSDGLVRSALRDVGVDGPKADIVLTHDRATRSNLLQAVAQMRAQLAKGKRFTHPDRMLMRIAWGEPGVKEKVAMARAKTSEQFARLRQENAA